jgi:hypothetical protein
VSRGGRRRSSPLGKSAAAHPISAVLPATVAYVRPPRTPSVHVRTAQPRISQSRAGSHQTRVLACRPSPSWSSCVGSARQHALVPSSRNRYSRCSPYDAPGNRKIGCARMGPAAAAGSCMVATPVAAVARSASDASAGYASPQGRCRAFVQRRSCWISPPATAVSLKP